MKKEGFTLIEVLGVIVVLSIIALITTSIILSLIEKIKIGAIQNSAIGYVEAIHHMMIETTMDGKKIQDGMIQHLATENIAGYQNAIYNGELGTIRIQGRTIMSKEGSAIYSNGTGQVYISNGVLSSNQNTAIHRRD